ncbi:MAG: ACP S-malonyltransferase [Zoogloeaceae bacterium]|jgi:[acyl-carrier-protein] S-malonyltransferase|nr:ACP S-malonyltransferase [Zoogloeaceae bacterium]
MSFAFVFPGQGSQSVGMMSAYAANEKDAAVVRTVFSEASNALGEDLWQMVESGDGETLARTVNTQPVMLTAGVAVWRLWQAKGGKNPACLAGHSLGEYSALVAAGALSFADAVPLVRLRAAAMQEAVPLGAGSMAAVMGLEDEAIHAACAAASSETGGVAEAVNFNAVGQTVIAGSQDAVKRAMVLCKEKGAKRALALPVSAPFHSSLMRPAAEKLAVALEKVEFRPPQIPVINNVDVAVESAPEKIRDALVRQAYRPVRWVEIIRRMEREGVEQVVECGPGKVLAGLAKRCAEGVNGIALADAASVEANLTLE